MIHQVKAITADEDYMERLGLRETFARLRLTDVEPTVSPRYLTFFSRFNSFGSHFLWVNLCLCRFVLRNYLCFETGYLYTKCWGKILYLRNWLFCKTLFFAKHSICASKYCRVHFVHSWEWKYFSLIWRHSCFCCCCCIPVLNKE